MNEISQKAYKNLIDLIYADEDWVGSWESASQMVDMWLTSSNIVIPEED